MFLHVVNTSRTRDIPAVVAVDGMKVRPGKAYQIAQDPLFEVDRRTAASLAPVIRDENKARHSAGLRFRR